MLILTPNQANQTARLTLNEGRTKLGDYTHYLLILSFDDTGIETENTLAQVVTVTEESARVTTFTCTTVGLDYQGKYWYKVYGQNSASNTDPENASVVGLVEQGSAIITNNASQYVDTTTTDNATIYG